MNDTIRRLINTTYSSDVDESEEAFLQLGLLLEIHTFNSRYQSQYDTLLPSEVRRMVLDESEQVLLVTELSKLVGVSASMTNNAIQTMRIAKPSIAFIPLLTIIRDKSFYLDLHSTRQVLIGLERYIRDAIKHLTN
ncbi:MAG: hypothetical protein HC876_20025 [Chloroflexaceae bacterium]|nr:hypothetical protein [Chloroflexaceae bacterium]